MRVIVLGCGRLGSRVANMLDAAGHEVTVIDRDPRAFELAAPRLLGRADRRLRLRPPRARAGADRPRRRVRRGDRGRQPQPRRRARGQAALPRADRGRAHLRPRPRADLPGPGHPHRLAGPVVGRPDRRHPAAPGELETEREFGNGEVAQIRVVVPPQLAGRTVQDVTIPGDIAVTVIVRAGRALLPTLGTQLRDGRRRALRRRPRGVRALRVLPGDARMKVLVAGGGNVGRYLGRILVAQRPRRSR